MCLSSIGDDFDFLRNLYIERLSKYLICMFRQTCSLDGLKAPFETYPREEDLWRFWFHFIAMYLYFNFSAWFSCESSKSLDHGMYVWAEVDFHGWNRTSASQIISAVGINDHSGYGLNQWETTLHCNVVSHWLSPYPECNKMAATKAVNANGAWCDGRLLNQRWQMWKLYRNL